MIRGLGEGGERAKSVALERLARVQREREMCMHSNTSLRCSSKRLCASRSAPSAAATSAASCARSDTRGRGLSLAAPTYRIALHCIALHCIALHCIGHCIALHCIALHCIGHCIALHIPITIIGIAVAVVVVITTTTAIIIVQNLSSSQSPFHLRKRALRGVSCTQPDAATWLLFLHRLLLVAASSSSSSPASETPRPDVSTAQPKTRQPLGQVALRLSSRWIQSCSCCRDAH
eukprot:384855-Rhodomonas_salina.1